MKRFQVSDFTFCTAMFFGILAMLLAVAVIY
jgi:hypothetical protein